MKDLKRRVLIVEDEESVLMNLSAFLEDEGFIVLGAATAEEALRIISSTEEIDAGIINIRLPSMDGNTLILEAHELNPRMGFVIHTGSISYTLPSEIIDIGVGEQQVFVKPVSDMNMLVRAIRDLTMP